MPSFTLCYFTGCLFLCSTLLLLQVDFLTADQNKGGTPVIAAAPSTNSTTVPPQTICQKIRQILSSQLKIVSGDFTEVTKHTIVEALEAVISTSLQWVLAHQIDPATVYTYDFNKAKNPQANSTIDKILSAIVRKIRFGVLAKKLHSIIAVSYENFQNQTTINNRDVKILERDLHLNIETDVDIIQYVSVTMGAQFLLPQGRDLMTCLRIVFPEVKWTNLDMKENTQVDFTGGVANDMMTMVALIAGYPVKVDPTICNANLKTLSTIMSTFLSKKVGLAIDSSSYTLIIENLTDIFDNSHKLQIVSQSLSSVTNDSLVFCPDFSKKVLEGVYGEGGPLHDIVKGPFDETFFANKPRLISLFSEGGLLGPILGGMGLEVLPGIMKNNSQSLFFNFMKPAYVVADLMMAATSSNRTLGPFGLTDLKKIGPGAAAASANAMSAVAAAVAPPAALSPIKLVAAPHTFAEIVKETVTELIVGNLPPDNGKCLAEGFGNLVGAIMQSILLLAVKPVDLENLIVPRNSNLSAAIELFFGTLQIGPAFLDKLSDIKSEVFYQFALTNDTDKQIVRNALITSIGTNLDLINHLVVLIGKQLKAPTIGAQFIQTVDSSLPSSAKQLSSSSLSNLRSNIIKNQLDVVPISVNLMSTLIATVCGADVQLMNYTDCTQLSSIVSTMTGADLRIVVVSDQVMQVNKRLKYLNDPQCKMLKNAILEMDASPLQLAIDLTGQNIRGGLIGEGGPFYPVAYGFYDTKVLSSKDLVLTVFGEGGILGGILSLEKSVTVKSDASPNGTLRGLLSSSYPLGYWIKFGHMDNITGPYGIKKDKIPSSGLLGAIGQQVGLTIDTTLTLPEKLAILLDSKVSLKTLTSDIRKAAIIGIANLITAALQIALTGILSIPELPHFQAMLFPVESALAFETALKSLVNGIYISPTISAKIESLTSATARSLISSSSFPDEAAKMAFILKSVEINLATNANLINFFATSVASFLTKRPGQDLLEILILLFPSSSNKAYLPVFTAKLATGQIDLLAGVVNNYHTIVMSMAGGVPIKVMDGENVEALTSIKATIRNEYLNANPSKINDYKSNLLPNTTLTLALRKIYHKLYPTSSPLPIYLNISNGVIGGLFGKNAPLNGLLTNDSIMDQMIKDEYLMNVLVIEGGILGSLIGNFGKKKDLYGILIEDQNGLLGHFLSSKSKFGQWLKNGYFDKALGVFGFVLRCKDGKGLHGFVEEAQPLGN